MSQWRAVISGIPQGSVLGPVLFIIYINDLPDLVENFTMLFADDTKLYSAVNNTNDHDSLQNDLNKLIHWSEKWQLNFLMRQNVRSYIMAETTTSYHTL